MSAGSRVRDLIEVDGSARSAATLVLSMLVGMAAFAIVLQFRDAGYKAWVILAGVGLLPTAIAVTGRPKELLLFGWVFSLTYNRQYFVFERFVGYNGTQGPYVMLADVCLAGLFGWWLYEWIVLRTHRPARSAPLWPWYFPYAAICFVTIFQAVRPDWTAYEMLRVIRMGLILFYVRHNVGRREWRVILAGLAAAVSFQAAVAIKEIATGRPGVIGLSKIADAPDFIGHLENGAFTGMIRGVGTMAHPPYLSCYLLLVLPVLLGWGLVGRGLRGRGAALAFLIGCGGLVATLSRWPWVVAAVQCTTVAAALVLFRQVAVQRALGIAVIAALLLGAGAVPFRDKLVDRLTGDLAESMDYRSEGMDASLKAVEDRPWLGFGLNNTSVYLGHYLPGMEWALVTEEFATHTLHLRAPVALGNGFMHVVEETGILGAFAFCIFLGGALLTGVLAIARVAGEHRAVCLGMLVGLLGALAEQVVDAPLWVDPVLYTFVLFIGLLNVAPVLFGAGAEAEGALTS